MIVDSTSESNTVNVERVAFAALDGFPLGGFLHSTRTCAPPRMAVIFAAGGGVRVARYKHFLCALARHGIPCLAFDVRGIGESCPPRLRGLVAGFEDWAEYDTAGAIEWMGARFPHAALTGIAHSIGCLLIGAPTNVARLSQFVFIAPHTGYHRDYSLRVRWRFQLSLCAAGPPLERVFGYFPGSLLGLGEDVPSLAAAQMADRTTPRIIEGIGGSDPARQKQLVDRIGRLRLPALVVSFTDDPWATEMGVRRFLHAYQNLLVVRRVVAPEDCDRVAIGHWGFFRRSAASTMWPFVLHFVGIDAGKATHPA
jgi:predicted alpha/beta hydrolase